jgi:hypothetical protein
MGGGGAAPRPRAKRATRRCVADRASPRLARSGAACPAAGPVLLSTAWGRSLR